MHISEKSTDPRRIIHILQHQNARHRNLQYAVPQFRAVMEGSAPRGRFASAETCSDRIAHDRRRLRKYAADAAVGKSSISQSDVESLDGIRDHTGIKLAKIV